MRPGSGPVRPLAGPKSGAPGREGAGRPVLPAPDGSVSLQERCLGPVEVPGRGRGEQKTMGLPPGDFAPGSPDAAGTPGAVGPAGAPAPAQARTATGDTRVDEALARLDDLAGLPVAEHPAVFEYVHERLTEALGDLDVRDPAGPGGPEDQGPDTLDR